MQLTDENIQVDEGTLNAANLICKARELTQDAKLGEDPLSPKFRRQTSDRHLGLVQMQRFAAYQTSYPGVA